jgi:glycosyltransferase involved in cell wall biosynthesis
MRDANTNPLVTVLMPVYNGEEFLHEAIESILKQTYLNFELLIINDGSTDSSENIILSYPDTRIRYIKNESNIKLIATLNNGFALAQGKYIVRMDADDYSVKERLQKQVAFMEANPEVTLAGSWFETIGDEPSRVVKYESDVNFYPVQNVVPNTVLPSFGNFEKVGNGPNAGFV